MVKVRCNTNIALVKYWGKRDEKLYLPVTGSISMTLDEFYTETEVDFTNGSEDEFILDGNYQSGEELVKISKFIDIFRDLASTDKRVRINSINHVPTGAGLASSASGYGALAGALNLLFNLNLNKSDLSKLARRGSGSATRSLMGGFVEWTKGVRDDGEDSMAVELDPGDWDIAMTVVMVNENKKRISSTKGMKRTVQTSPFYSGWVQEQREDIDNMKSAIKAKDIDKLGEVAERNALKMHGTMLAAKPPIIYFEPDTIKAMEIVESIRAEGISAYYTMDAGPNVKVISKRSELELVRSKLLKYFSDDRIISSTIGSGLEIIYDGRG